MERLSSIRCFRNGFALLACVLAGSGMASAQAQGVEPRVTALEEQMASVNQQTASLAEQLTALQQQLASALAQVTALENLWQPMNINVDCAAGQTVQAALAQAAKRTGFVTITVIGMCTEAVQLSRSSTRIRGATPGDGLAAPSATATVVTASAAHDVVIDGVTVSGGSTGLAVGNGAQVSVRNSVIAHNSFQGATVDNSFLELRNTTVENNHDGLTAWLGSLVRISGGQIQNNGRIGIGLYTGSSVRLDGDARVTGNIAGVNVRFGSVLELRRATVEANAQGISAIGGATVLLGTGAIIQNNQHDGLSLMDTSVVGVLGDGQAQIINNGGWGVVCSPSPGVAQISTGPSGLGTISGNAAGQANCPSSPPPQ